jgi:hypothetical protein
MDIPLDENASTYTVSGTTYEVVPDVLAIIPLKQLSDLKSLAIIKLKSFASVSSNLSTRLPDIIEAFSSEECTNIPITREILEELEWSKSGLSRLNLANHGLVMIFLLRVISIAEVMDCTSDLCNHYDVFHCIRILGHTSRKCKQKRVEYNQKFLSNKPQRDT